VGQTILVSSAGLGAASVQSGFTAAAPSLKTRK